MACQRTELARWIARAATAALLAPGAALAGLAGVCRPGGERGAGSAAIHRCDGGRMHPHGFVPFQRQTALARHRDQVLNGMTGRDFQIAVRRPEKIETLVLAIDQHSRRRVGLHDQPLAKVGQGRRAQPFLFLILTPGRPGSVGGANQRAELAWSAPTYAPIDAIRFGDRLEATVDITDRFGAADMAQIAVSQEQCRKAVDGLGAQEGFGDKLDGVGRAAIQQQIVAAVAVFRFLGGGG